MNNIFSMTLSGSILLLLFLLVEKLCNNLFSQQLRYRVLKIALFFHIFPLNIFISFLKEKFNFINTRNIFANIFINGYKPVTLINSEELQYNTAFKINYYVLAIWIFIFCILFLYYMIDFIFSKRYIYKNSQEVTSPNILNIRDKYQLKLKIKQKVRIYSTNDDCTPFTLGIIRPIIVIPQLKEPFEFDIAIYHELYHIKNKDMLILFLRLLITSVYWFNPLIFLLNYKLENNCEFACDEFITKDLNYDKRRKYVDLIIELAKEDKDSFQKPMIGFNNQKKVIKERIDIIMDQKKRKTNAAIILSTLLVLCSVIPAFAYEPVQKFEYQAKDNVTINIPTSKDFIAYSNSNTYDETNEYDFPIYYENQFTDSYGNIYDADIPTPHKDCTHSFSDGTLTTHYVNSSGGCTMSYYHAERCSKCGLVSINSLFKTVEYVKCPH